MTATTNEQDMQNPAATGQDDAQGGQQTSAGGTGPADTSNGVQGDLDQIVPDPAELVVNDIPVTIRRLKSREFFHVVRVITNGMGPAITSIRLDVNDPEAMRSSITAILLYAVPNAIEDFGEFLKAIIDPKDPKRRKELGDYLENPDIDVLFDVLTVVVDQEQDDFRALAGKVQAWISKISGATGQG